MDDEINTGDEQELDTEAQGWEKAFDDYSAEEGVEPKEKEDTNEDTEAPEDSEETTPPEKEDTNEDTTPPPPVTPPSINPAPSSREQYMAREKAIKDDIREQMFKSTPDELTDQDGDPIKSIQDVMQRINPETGEAFTQPEAAMWLLAAQKQLETAQDERDTRISEVAEVTMSIAEEMDAVSETYKDYFEAMPDLTEKILSVWKETLEVDPNTEIITKAPVSLKYIAEMIMDPYQKLAQRLAEEEESKNIAEEKAKAKRSRANSRVDREDIISNGSKPTEGDEEAEGWAKAARAVL